MYFLLEEGEVVCGSCVANIAILCYTMFFPGWYMVYGIQIYEYL